jgi:hypothetical protein
LSKYTKRTKKHENHNNQKKAHPEVHSCVRISGNTPFESHLQTSAVYGGQMRKNNITIEKIRKKQGQAELQSDPLRFQELQQTQSMQCGISPKTHHCNLTI